MKKSRLDNDGIVSTRKTGNFTLYKHGLLNGVQLLLSIYIFHPLYPLCCTRGIYNDYIQLQ